MSEELRRLKQWCENIRMNEDLSYGGLRTLNDVEKLAQSSIMRNTGKKQAALDVVDAITGFLENDESGAVFELDADCLHVVVLEELQLFLHELREKIKAEIEERR
jgi:hypothetical protein